jgi:cation transport regulator ChaB
MPHATRSELSPAARRLPPQGQEIFLSAFNNAWQTDAERGFDEREEVAALVAWAAV